MANQKQVEEILKNLNLAQKKAVIHEQGPLLVIAGAGTGKTTVITKRIAWLILNDLAKTDQILALTFTDKAAQEMEERVDFLLPYGYVDLWISTFHSFCEKILQQHALDIGLPINFKLLNETQQNFLVQENLDKFDLDYYKPLGNPTKFVQSLVKHFSRAKDELITPEDYLAYADELAQDKDTTMSDELLDQEVARVKEVANAYYVYQQLLLDNNALDFGDIINYTLTLFKKRPKILEKYRQQFKYILVDEFQDTNWAQYKLLEMLAQPDNNLTVVSDDDQSVYKFRGASYNNVLQFRKDYPKSKQVILIKNYRSCQNILDLSYKFIQKNNPARLEAQEKKIVKKLMAEKKEKGDIDYFKFKNAEDEAQGVIKKIISIKDKDKKATWNDFAILVRANNQAEIFVQALNFAGIPHQFLARRGLFSKPIILDILSYLKLLDNYHESSAVYRVLTSPIFKDKISNEDLIKLTNYSNKKSWSLYQTIKNSSLVPGLSSKTIKALEDFLVKIEKHTNLAKTESVSKIIYAFLEDSGYLKILSNEKEENQNIFWLNQFFKKVENFEAINFNNFLNNFIRMIDLMIETGDTGSMEAEIQEGPESVKVSTIHGAKGLEFKYIFIINLVNRRFPTIERKDPIEIPDKLIKEIIPQGDIHLQEERRLFYVALTRAKKGLYLTSAEDYGGKTTKKPSQFLYELDLLKDQENSKKIESNNILNKPKIDKKQKKKNKNIEQYLPAKFSFSQFIAYNNCPLQYKYSFVLKIPCRGKAVFSFGKTIHTTLQQFCSAWKEKQETFQKNIFNDSKTKSNFKLDLDYLIKIYEQCWADEWYQSEKQKKEYYQKGKKLLKLFYQDFISQKPKIKDLEKGFNFKLDKYLIKGVIDRIDETKDGYQIIDYKTGQSKKLSKENKYQLLIYQIAMEKLGKEFNKPVESLTFYYLEEGKKVSFLGSEEEKEEVKKEIIKTIKKIRQGDFTPKPGYLCKYCDFFHICPYRQE